MAQYNLRVIHTICDIRVVGEERIAKYFGTEVTDVDNNKKLDMLRSIGADHVIDLHARRFHQKFLVV
jgi:hypothetical protein